MIPKETFKPVVGFEDLYEVSNRGAVIGVKRLRKKRTWVRPEYGNGNVYVTLYKDGIGYNKLVAKLMANAYFGYTGTVLHIDGNKLNNTLGNFKISW